MNTSRVATVNTPAVIAVMAFALVVAALFGTPSGSTTADPVSEEFSQVAAR
jgi:hypothetical protein